MSENWKALEYLEAIHTQWKTTECIKTGLDYAGVDVVLRRRFPDDKTAFEVIQQCESFILNALYRQMRVQKNE